MLDSVMHIVAAILVPIFVFGMCVSAIVVAITLVGDIRDFRSKDDPAESKPESL